MTANDAINTLRQMEKDLPFHKDEYEAIEFGVTALYTISMRPEQRSQVNTAALEMLEALKKIRKLGYGSALQKSGAVILQLVTIAEDAIAKAERAS